MTDTASEVLLIVLFYLLDVDIVGEPFFDNVSEVYNIAEMAVYVAFAHNKTYVFYLRQIVGAEAVLPVEWDIAALHNEVLTVLNGGLDHLFQNVPEVRRQLVIVIGRELGLTASYQPHFQVVYGQVGVLVFFKQLLCEERLPRM